MPELQTAYTGTVTKGYAGMVANGETSNRISRTVEDAAGIAFGKPVYRGTGDHGCTATVGTLATFLGFTIATSAQGYVAGQDADEYQQYDTASVLTSGAIYVNVTAAVADGAAITMGTGGGAADALSSVAADATHIATGFIADETTTGAGLVRIVKR
jgi:hypothetical protein